MESDYLEIWLKCRKSIFVLKVSGALSTVLENPRERFIPYLIVPITASGLLGDQPLVDRTM
jgi:hypothetical protein